MKTLYWCLGIALVLVISFFALSNYTYNAGLPETIDDSLMTQTIEIIPIEHATAVLRWGDTTLYLDPTGEAAAFSGQPPADIVLVTDIHGDHFSTSTLAAVTSASTTLIVPQAVKNELPAELASRAKILANGETANEHGLSILAMPMYNLPDAENSKFHTKGRGNGYVLEKDGMRVYIAGDTAGIPEMRALTNIEVALIPMNLPYTMSVDEAADAVLAFKPKQVYPYHYRGPDGLADVNKFKQLVNARDPNIIVVLTNWYPQ